MKAGGKEKKPDSSLVEPSSGNVFQDLGLANADEHLARAQLAHQICEIIAVRGLTQTAAAAILEIDQPKVSALMRGKLAGFSTDRLFRFLNALGSDVEIVIRAPKRASRPASVRVVTARKAS
jgi:predicted XRE-type DNA-binding protein